METNELRLGNLVLDKDGNIETINEISKYGDLYRINELDPDYFRAIPLDKEWLLKLGFEYSDSKIKDYPQLLSIEISSLETLDFEDGEFFISNVSSVRVLTLWNQPESVHQLQNLLFALNGK